MTDQDALREMLNKVLTGRAVLTTGVIHEDIPTIHQVGYEEGCRLRTKTDVRHAGFGLFFAETEHGKLSFDGGGAMRRAETFSWCPLVTDDGVLDDLGYDLLKAEKALTVLLIQKASVSA